jgi:hypothetical protein
VRAGKPPTAPAVLLLLHPPPIASSFVPHCWPSNPIGCLPCFDCALSGARAEVRANGHVPYEKKSVGKGVPTISPVDNHYKAFLFCVAVPLSGHTRYGASARSFDGSAVSCACLFVRCVWWLRSTPADGPRIHILFTRTPTLSPSLTGVGRTWQALAPRNLHGRRARPSDGCMQHTVSLVHA